VTSGADTHPVDEQVLAHLERLARLVIEPSERENLKHDLVELLGFVDDLLGADVDGVSEYRTGAGDRTLAGRDQAAARERADEVRPSLPPALALAAAPATQGEFFQVPRTVEEG